MAATGESERGALGHNNENVEAGGRTGALARNDEKVLRAATINMPTMAGGAMETTGWRRNS